MNRYDEFPDVPAYMMSEDTDPSLIPDPDALESDDVDLPTDREEEVNIEDVVNEIEHERKEDDNADDDDIVVVIEEVEEEEEVVDIETEEDDEVIT